MYHCFSKTFGFGCSTLRKLLCPELDAFTANNNTISKPVGEGNNASVSKAAHVEEMTKFLNREPEEEEEEEEEDKKEEEKEYVFKYCPKVGCIKLAS